MSYLVTALTAHIKPGIDTAKTLAKHRSKSNLYVHGREREREREREAFKYPFGIEGLRAF